ncbi:ankyrin repeat and IBR domain-containing protein 1-like isoform X2 [Oscarella lobularis]|uniref:ankyrin repeat and IBR domain-containing protein 1-like isoform X2 n=1 Tax=Oscarella lobularis TaxID=121494 RepID=UPI0033141A5C
MGSTTSRFRTALSRGEIRDAAKIWREESADFRRNLSPNENYGDGYGNNTPFLFAAMYAIEPILYFLYEGGGNPNHANANAETALHLACSPDDSPLGDMRRAQIVEHLILGQSKTKWCLLRAKIDLKDKNGDTALHWAARSGLKRCVEILVHQGSSVYAENERKETPCDCASRARYNDIAEMLESLMVFSGSPADSEKSDHDAPETETVTCGLKAQEVREVKDKLLVETSDMLGVPLFTAEALLRNYEWSKEALLEAWMENATSACEKAGVKLPDTDDVFATVNDIDVEMKAESSRETEEEVTAAEGRDKCTICEDNVVVLAGGRGLIPIPCGHSFCSQCWETYLTVKIKEGDAHNIKCPAHKCNILVPLETIEQLVSRDMARRYLHFDIKAFVESNPQLQWCPFPGCGRVVQYPIQRSVVSDSSMAAALVTRPATDVCTWRAVDCGDGHQFCWGCREEAHEPCPCNEWRLWHEKMREMLPKETQRKNGTLSTAERNAAAASLWLAKHTKLCPKCKSPIQKTEGCNHVSCTKCKHDFCWVCMDEWGKHSSATGGYFKCNRYEIIGKLKKTKQESVAEASEAFKTAQETHRFNHFYNRFDNHGESSKIEAGLLTKGKARIKRLALARAKSDSVAETCFFELAVGELLKVRRVLRCSYAHGFYLTASKSKAKRAVFESMQNELEDATEQLAQMVNRPNLRTPRGVIVAATGVLRRKRREFLDAAEKGYVPDGVSAEDDPSLREATDDDDDDDDDDNAAGILSRHYRRRRRFFADFDDDDDDDDDDDNVLDSDGDEVSPRALDRFRHLLEMLESLTDPERLCARDSCQNPRRQNQYCSDRCAMIDRGRRVMNRIMGRTPRSDSDAYVASSSNGSRRHRRGNSRLRIRSDGGDRAAVRLGSPVPSPPLPPRRPSWLGDRDEEEGLQRAIEISRREALRDSRVTWDDNVDDLGFPNAAVDDDNDADLQLALRLSLLEMDKDQLGIASSPRLSFSREVSEMGYFGGDRDDNGFDLDVPGEDSSRPFATDL